MQEQDDLEERFYQPADWQWGTTVNDRGHTLRYGSLPTKEKPVAHIIYVEGASECAEKTFEMSRTFNQAACGFWVLDRAGLGLSDRLLTKKFKQHSEGFHHDAADIIRFRHDIVPDDGTPVILLGHSTGGLIALMATHDSPDSFAAAALTAPLLGLSQPTVIKNREHIFARLPLPQFLRTFTMPGHEKWKPRDADGYSMSTDDYSGDDKRKEIHDYWPRKNKDLQIGSFTLGWLSEACKSMVMERNPAWLKEVKTPLHIFTGGDDKLINNEHTYKAIQHLPNIQHTHLPDGRHDLLMERDHIHDTIITNVIKMAHKPPGP